jgi:hypothetical protein
VVNFFCSHREQKDILEGLASNLNSKEFSKSNAFARKFSKNENKNYKYNFLLTKMNTSKKLTKKLNKKSTQNSNGKQDFDYVYRESDFDLFCSTRTRNGKIISKYDRRKCHKRTDVKIGDTVVCSDSIHQGYYLAMITDINNEIWKGVIIHDSRLYCKKKGEIVQLDSALLAEARYNSDTESFYSNGFTCHYKYSRNDNNSDIETGNHDEVQETSQISEQENSIKTSSGLHDRSSSAVSGTKQPSKDVNGKELYEFFSQALAEIDEISFPTEKQGFVSDKTSSGTTEITSDSTSKTKSRQRSSSLGDKTKAELNSFELNNDILTNIISKEKSKKVWKPKVAKDEFLQESSGTEKGTDKNKLDDGISVTNGITFHKNVVPYEEYIFTDLGKHYVYLLNSIEWTSNHDETISKSIFNGETSFPAEKQGFVSDKTSSETTNSCNKWTFVNSRDFLYDQLFCESPTSYQKDISTNCRETLCDIIEKSLQCLEDLYDKDIQVLGINCSMINEDENDFYKGSIPYYGNNLFVLFFGKPGIFSYLNDKDKKIELPCSSGDAINMEEEWRKTATHNIKVGEPSILVYVWYIIKK